MRVKTTGNIHIQILKPNTHTHRSSLPSFVFKTFFSRVRAFFVELTIENNKKTLNRCL